MRTSLKIALGVALAVGVVLVALALLGGDDDDGGDDDARPLREPAALRIEADPEVCWSVLFAESDFPYEGCGQGYQAFPLTDPRTAVVTKTDDASTVTAVLLGPDDEERSRRDIGAGENVVEISP